MLFVISETGKRAYNVVGVFGANFLEYSFDASGNTGIQTCFEIEIALHHTNSNKISTMKTIKYNQLVFRSSSCRYDS